MCVWKMNDFVNVILVFYLLHCKGDFDFCPEIISMHDMSC